jgi:hypothetical protein
MSIPVKEASDRTTLPDALAAYMNLYRLVYLRMTSSRDK